MASVSLRTMFNLNEDHQTCDTRRQISMKCKLETQDREGEAFLNTKASKKKHPYGQIYALAMFEWSNSGS